MAYLDHINGKWHNRALGMSMTVEKSTADQVRKRLEEAKRRKKLGGGGSSGALGGGGVNRNEEKELVEHIPDGMDKERLKKENDAIDSEDKDEEEEEGGGVNFAVASGNGDGENDKDEEDEDGVDPDFAAMMGFGGFGGSKKR